METDKNQVEEELAQLSQSQSEDDGEGDSTMQVESQLNHLQTLLELAETEMVGGLKIQTSVEMAELTRLLDPPTPTNILHQTTTENILDMLGLSEEPIRKKPANQKKQPSFSFPQEQKEVKVELQPISEETNTTPEEPMDRYPEMADSATPSNEEPFTPEMEPETVGPSGDEKASMETTTDEPSEAEKVLETQIKEAVEDAAVASTSEMELDTVDLSSEENATMETATDLSPVEAETVLETQIKEAIEDAAVASTSEMELDTVDPSGKKSVMMETATDLSSVEAETVLETQIKEAIEDATVQKEEAAQEGVVEAALVEDWPLEEKESAAMEVAKDDDSVAAKEGVTDPVQNNWPLEEKESAAKETAKDDDSVELLVLPEPGSEEDEQRESKSFEIVLPSQTQENEEENKEETSSVFTPDVEQSSLPFLLEDDDRDIVAAASDTIMFRSGRLWTELKLEVKKLRADYKRVEANNKRLSQANSSAGASFESLNKHAQQLQKKLEESQAEVTEANAALAESKTLVAELRDELAMKQASYVGEVQSRLRYQKAIQEVADLVQNSCKDTNLVEQVLSLTDKVDEEAMAVPDMKTTEETNSVAESSSGTEDTPTMENTSRCGKEHGGYMSYIKACVWTT